jgi:hypothetical protein
VETDGVLIERSVRGRPDAFVEVVRRHEVAVHGFLARREGNAKLQGSASVAAIGGRGAAGLARLRSRGPPL